LAKKSDLSKKDRQPATFRLIAAWLLITFGLAGVISGFFMFFAHSVMSKAAKQISEQDRFGDRARFLGRYLPWSWDMIGFYGGGCSGILVGSICTYLGVRLRRAKPKKGSRRKATADAGEKRICPACGGQSPISATKCYQCGQTLPL
jgi:ribosomal protein L40E